MSTSIAAFFPEQVGIVHALNLNYMESTMFCFIE